jgi:hypothetical protein
MRNDANGWYGRASAPPAHYAANQGELHKYDQQTRPATLTVSPKDFEITIEASPVADAQRLDSVNGKVAA